MADLRATVHPGLAPLDLAQLHRFMLLQRLAEERIVKLYYQGAIAGACFTGCGHEAVAVGAAYALGPGRVPRGSEPGGRPPAAAGARLLEQPVRLLHPAQPRDRRSDRRPDGRVRHARLLG